MAVFASRTAPSHPATAFSRTSVPSYVYMSGTSPVTLCAVPGGAGVFLPPVRGIVWGTPRLAVPSLARNISPTYSNLRKGSKRSLGHIPRFSLIRRLHDNSETWGCPPPPPPRGSSSAIMIILTYCMLYDTPEDDATAARRLSFRKVCPMHVIPRALPLALSQYCRRCRLFKPRHFAIPL